MNAARRPLVAANWKMNGSLVVNEKWTSAFFNHAP
jgi:triosephosphate isomerase